MKNIKKIIFKIFLTILAVIMCLLSVACDDQADEPLTWETTDGATSAEESFETAETEAPDPKAHLAVNVKWNLGYIGSDKNPLVANKISNSAQRYSYTDVFTVEKAGTTITFTDDNTNANGDMRFANDIVYVVSSWKQDNGEWVIDRSRANYSGGNTRSPIIVSVTNSAIVYEYTTSYDNENLRLCFASGQTDGFTPARFPTVYEESLGKEATYLKDKGAGYYGILEGLTLSAVGDSYFDGEFESIRIGQENIWVNLLATKYGMTHKVDGVAGATVSDSRRSRVPVCERYKNILEGSDIVLLEGGRNDYNLPVADSTLASNFTQVPLGDINSTDTKTFMGAWNVIISGVKEKCPDAMIVLITPWNFANNNAKPITREQYINAMKQVAEKHGVYLIDASDTTLTGVDMQDSGFRYEYCFTPGDVSHLNAKGMAMVKPRFEKIIAEYYSEFLSK